jgi:ornithine cyclodeaminase/alanine dehydrogenase-like protein (mu-crystallin family)
MSGLHDVAIIDAGEVARRAPYADLVATFEAGHREPIAACERIVYGPDHDPRRFMALPAWQTGGEGGGAIGIKLVTVFPDNPRRGIPAVQALVLLFDGETGEALAMIDGTELTYRKTASDSALGSRLLSRPDSRTLLMVGAGGLAEHLIAAHRSVRPSIERVLIWNRTGAKAEALVDFGVADEVVDDLDAAVNCADVISSATMTRDPLIKGALLRPGTHVDCVGAFLPDHREVDDDVVTRAEIFVDSREAAVHESGDLVIPLAAGTIDSDAVRADLFQLCQGEHRGRSGPDPITMFENGGGGHLDLMVARHLWASHQAG